MKIGVDVAPFDCSQNLPDFVAPCSLLCYTCTGFSEGVVARCAQALHRHLDGFGELRGSGMEPAQREEWDRYFADFRGTLGFLGAASCPGCRKGAAQGCCIPGCPIPSCAKERGVDFCGECPDFPCEKAGGFFAAQGSGLRKVWEDGSRCLREIGAADYFEEKKDSSHYLHCKK